MIVARVIEPAAKRATARQLSETTAVHSLDTVLDLGDVDEDELYAALDLLGQAQPKVEAALAKRHLSSGSLVLYDLTSSYLEGQCCELAHHGYSRDGQPGKKQSVFGLLCAANGCPIAVAVFDGNTADPATLAAQVSKLRERFKLDRVVLVGDRGMITNARIEADLKPAGLDWVTALRATAIQALAEEGGPLQLSLFDTRWRDVIGLYLNPPAKALVLCCDEKSQCQALERTQPGLPLAPKRPPTMTHDDVRHGTITLFAALSQLTGKLITRTEAAHTHVEWLGLLKQIDRETPRDVDLHLIADNDATHKHPTVREWLAKHPRLHMHFTPTSSSWLNLVERFFADLTGDVVRAGSFTSVNELVRDIEAYLAVRNADPKPYVWRAAGAEIRAKIKRARRALTAAAAG